RQLRQVDVAAMAGVSRQTVSRIELGHLDSMQLETLRDVCHAVGLRLTLEVRGHGADVERLIGARHSAMHEAIARLFADLPDWGASPEVPSAISPGGGATAAPAGHEPTRSLLVIELKTELADIQDTVGVIDRKVRLATKVARERGWFPASVSVWLVVAE